MTNRPKRHHDSCGLKRNHFYHFARYRFKDGSFRKTTAPPVATGLWSAGTRADAEDIVQDAFLRLGRIDPESLRNPEAWLTTVVTHLALDRLRSARHQREIYVGSWIPEPFVEYRNPEQEQITRSNLSIAVLFLVEQLRPQERAVFLLREVFDVSYAVIAGLIGEVGTDLPANFLADPFAKS